MGTIKGMALGALGMMLASSATLFMKYIFILNPNYNPFQLSYWRNIISLLFILTVMVIKGEVFFKILKSPVLNRKLHQKILIKGLYFMVGSTLHILSLKFITATRAIVLLYANPVFTILFSKMVNKESP
jgi:drug/metabolite transporter (DMT)-like permease